MGDLVLVRHRGPVATGIRLFERLRRPRGVDRAAWPSGMCLQPRRHRGRRGARRWVFPGRLSGRCPGQAVRHGRGGLRRGACRDDGLSAGRPVAFARRAVGSSYGYLSIFADAFNALTGLELSLSLGDRMVCSTQATRALERAGLIPDRAPAAVAPAHLAAYFGVGYPAPAAP